MNGSDGGYGGGVAFLVFMVSGLIVHVFLGQKLACWHESQ
jgi:hypothetical protein